MGLLFLTLPPYPGDSNTIENFFPPCQEEQWGCPFLTVTGSIVLPSEAVEVLTPGIGSLQKIELT